MENLSFGQFVKAKRIELNKTLREFCIENKLNPVYISKLERRRLTPPQNENTLNHYANSLDLNKQDSIILQELARREKDYTPHPLNDEQLLTQLPMPAFMKPPAKKLNETDIMKLAEMIREA